LRAASGVVAAAAGAVQVHLSAIDDLQRFLETGEAPTGHEPERKDSLSYVQPYVVYDPRNETYLTVDSFERERPYLPLPLIEEANVRARVGTAPLESHLSAPTDAQNEQPAQALIFYSFTNHRSFDENLADFAEFADKQEKNLYKMGCWRAPSMNGPANSI
jgi:hypothetical protein